MARATKIIVQVPRRRLRLAILEALVDAGRADPTALRERRLRSRIEAAQAVLNEWQQTSGGAVYPGGWLEQLRNALSGGE